MKWQKNHVSAPKFCLHSVWRLSGNNDSLAGENVSVFGLFLPFSPAVRLDAVIEISEGVRKLCSLITPRAGSQRLSSEAAGVL
uniref:Uncharacterized protein n=1 Tax=Anguilla anguilla TaxID=7936 RepID=A0A0E9Q914_ANGAN